MLALVAASRKCRGWVDLGAAWGPWQLSVCATSAKRSQALWQVHTLGSAWAVAVAELQFHVHCCFRVEYAPHQTRTLPKGSGCSRSG